MLKPVALAFCISFFLFTSSSGQDSTTPDLIADWTVRISETPRLPSGQISWSARDLQAEQNWSLTDLVTDERCSPPLRATLFTEIYTRQSAMAKAASMKYLWCRIDAGSEAEAKNQNIDMKAIYDGLPIDASANDAFSRARTWRQTNCEKQDLQTYLTAAASEFAQVVNTPVALRALDVYETCIQSTAKGLHCRAKRYTSDTVGFYISYMPDGTNPDGTIKAPRIVTSAAFNAHQPANPADHSVFKTRRIVPPGGIVATMVQDDPRKEVVFSIELTPGFPSCSEPLVVPAKPAYDVVAHVQAVQGSRTVTEVFYGSAHISHSKCAQSTPIPVPVQVCPGPGYVLDRNVRDWWNAQQNPGNPSGVTKNVCFGAIAGYIQGDGPNGCIDTIVTILECNQGQAPAACAYSWQSGANGGSTALASFPGHKNEVLTTGPFDRVWDDAEGGTQLFLETPGLPSGLTAMPPVWNVSIKNKITQQTILLSQPGKQVDGQFTASYDFEARALRIFLPKTTP